MPNRRYEANIPIESLRIVLDLAATGSVSKTAENMALTSPAISHQLKRLQQIIGGSLFERGATGYRATRLGETTIEYARRIVEANDRLISVTSQKGEDGIVRVGVPNIFIDAFLDQASRANVLQDLRIFCETSSVMERMLHDDLLDVALCFNADKRGAIVALAEWEEEFVWCKSPSFAIKPGAPVPILGFIDCPISKVAVQALEARGLFSRIAFVSADRYALKLAAKAGIGLLTVRPGMLDPSLIFANDNYLPTLPPLACGVYCRPSFDATKKYKSIVGLLAGRRATRVNR